MDFVLLVMNPKGANSILGSKVKLGADAAAVAGPKGRAAAVQTDIVMKAEVLTYSRSRGLFAGVSLEGSTLRADNRANRKLYGRELSARNIVRESEVGVPASGRELIALLDRQSPTKFTEFTTVAEKASMTRCLRRAYSTFSLSMASSSITPSRCSCLLGRQK